MKKNIHIIFLIVLLVINIGSIYLNTFYNYSSFEESLFYLKHGLLNGDLSIGFSAVKSCFIYFIILAIIILSLFYNIFNKNIKFKIKKKEFNIYPINFIMNHRIIFTIIYIIISINIIFYNLGFSKYIINNIKNSNFIKNNYYLDKNIKFNEKRNLIFIYVESLETSLFTKEQGGKLEYELIPELYNLLYEDDSIFFSANEKTTGMSYQSGSEWTTAAIVSTSTGLPFKIPISKNNFNKNNFMNNAYALGDVLKNNGYYNELISSADTSFGGIKDFYQKHGNYSIIDINSLKDYGFKIKDSEKGPWGMNDKYMFEVAKQRLLSISKEEKPFNLGIINIDTHPIDGNTYDYTIKKFNKQYENVYATEAKMLYNFISWIKEQDFYDNTTIVIVGDHLNIQSNLYNDNNDRYIYNVIINSNLTTDNTENRTFTAVDMYPTTLAAIGANINKDQLALGVNLFANKKTLAEKYGLDNFNNNLEKRSNFYNNYILKQGK